MNQKNSSRAIQTRFNRAAPTYDQHCLPQRIIAQTALRLLLNYRSHFSNIADFACGTGESTLHLYRLLAYSHCYAVDFADALLAQAKKKLVHLRHIEFMHADFQDPLSFSHPLDLIFCNMGLQWSSDFSATIQQWITYLNPNGLLLFSLPLDNNFPEINTRYKPKHLSELKIKSALLAHQWQIIKSQSLTFTMTFDHPITALKSLKSVGANATHSSVVATRGLAPIKLKHVFQDYSNPQLTYDIGIYLARRNE